MNIIDAVKELENGKNIRRKDLDIKLFIDRYFLLLDDLLATDWEEVE